MALPTGGFAAISQPPPEDTPLAITRVIQGEDGTLRTIYVDARTGAQLPSLNGYTISNSQNYLDPNTLDSPEAPQAAPAAPSVSQQVKQDAVDFGGGRSDQDYGSGGTSSAGGFATGRTSQNNYGYFDKPTGMGFAGSLPGPLGLAGKAANVAANVNNVAAVNAGRQEMGLDKLSGFDTVKGAISDRKGQVANVGINNENYSVGLEALDPMGRTTLTPSEASRRGQTLGGLVETPKSQVKDDNKAFAEEWGSPGFLGKAKDFISSIFDPKPQVDRYAAAPAPAQKSGQVTSGPYGGLGGSRGNIQTDPGRSYTGNAASNGSSRDPATKDRSGHGTFGTTDSPGQGRSSIGNDGGGYGGKGASEPGGHGLW